MSKARCFAVGLMCVVALASGGLARAARQNIPPQLATLIAEALAHNPELKAAKARWRLYENKVVPAGALDDPFLSFALNNYPVDTFRDDQTAMTGKVVKLTQKFPFPGKLAAKEELAGQMALWYKGVYEDGRLQLAGKVKDVYYLLYYLDRAVEITEKNSKLLMDFVRLTETNYEVGKGLQQDVLKAQVEHSKLTDTLITLKQRRLTTLANLNTLMNRPPGNPFEPEPGLELTKATVSLPEVRRQAEKKRPLFASYQALIARYRAQKTLARLAYKPDFKMGLAYTFREPNPADSGTDFAGVEFGINLPIFHEKRRAGVAEAEAGLRMAEKQYEEFRNRVFFNLEDAFARLEKSREQALLYKDGIIPQARQALEAAMGAYRVGRVSFLTLLDNFVTLNRYEMDYYRALTDTKRNFAKLEAEAGLDLNQTEP